MEIGWSKVVDYKIAWHRGNVTSALPFYPLIIKIRLCRIKICLAVKYNPNC